MALSALTAWEVRTTGSNANGGGFVQLATGTDFSQQDTPQISYTDLVIGATTTQMTSAANPFTSAHVGNIINVTGGTGFTIQRVQVVSVSGITATCDKACGTAASIGGTGNLGGGLLTIAQALTLTTVAGMTIWVKAGTYTQTVALAPSTTLFLVGYSATHGDSGLATITTATNSTPMFSQTTNITALSLANLTISNTAATSSTCFNASGTTMGTFCSNCSFSGFTNTFNSSNFTYIVLESCAITSCATGITSSPTIALIVNACYFHGCSTAAISTGSNLVPASIKNTIIAGCGAGMSLSTTSRLVLIVENCTIANNTGTGISFGNALNPTVAASAGGSITIKSCIIYGNGGFGVSATVNLPAQIYMAKNAIGSNTSGNYSNVSSTGDVTLTANPFATGTNNYALNTAAGGGAACKGVGLPAAFPGGTTIGTPDIGAVQSAGGSGATGGSYAYVG